MTFVPEDRLISENPVKGIVYDDDDTFAGIFT